MGNGDTAPPFLIWAPDRGVWSDSRSGRFIPVERKHLVTIVLVQEVGWTPRDSLNAVVQRKISFPLRESNPGCPVCSPSLYWLSYLGSCYSFQISQQYYDFFKFLCWCCYSQILLYLLSVTMYPETVSIPLNFLSLKSNILNCVRKHLVRFLDEIPATSVIVRSFSRSNETNTGIAP
jgi:hypothetical protein